MQSFFNQLVIVMITFGICMHYSVWPIKHFKMDYFELYCKNYNFHDIVLYCELRVEPDQQLEFLFLIDIY